MRKVVATGLALAMLALPVTASARGGMHPHGGHGGGHGFHGGGRGFHGGFHGGGFRGGRRGFGGPGYGYGYGYHHHHHRHIIGRILRSL